MTQGKDSNAAHLICELLGKHEHLTVLAMAKELGLHASTLHDHLPGLVRAGKLVRVKPRGYALASNSEQPASLDYCAIALPRQIIGSEPWVPQKWEPPRGEDPIIKSLGIV